MDLKIVGVGIAALLIGIVIGRLMKGNQDPHLKTVPKPTDPNDPDPNR